MLIRVTQDYYNQQHFRVLLQTGGMYGNFREVVFDPSDPNSVKDGIEACIDFALEVDE